MKKDLTEQWSDDDGVDPRQDKKRIQSSMRKNKADHGALRLARQMENHLKVVYPALAAGTMLSEFAINDLKPVAKGGSFVVQLYCTNPDFECDISAVLKELREIKPQLRSEVAKAIHRKNTPDFTFDVLPPNVSPFPVQPEIKQ